MLKAVTARARTLGLAVPDGELDEAALLDLICAPGFSTRDEIDRASGRGVGMAVVKTTVHELNGRISMSTTPGQGTRFAIELPLTLAITDALIATSAIGPSPCRSRRCARSSRSIHAIAAPGRGREIAPFRGGALPILRLSRCSASHRASAPRAARVRGRHRPGCRRHRGRSHRRPARDRGASMADALIRVDGIAGATDLGDGRVVLILDLSVLSRQTRAYGQARTSRVPASSALQGPVYEDGAR